jgi:hypothetical protein
MVQATDMHATSVYPRLSETVHLVLQRTKTTLMEFHRAIFCCSFRLGDEEAARARTKKT